MRHKKGFNKLSRSVSERRALKRNMVQSLFRYEAIRTTKAKAKEVQSMAEKLITRAKVDSVHNRRMVARDINDRAIVKKLFESIAPMFADRNGGYIRILKLGQRKGDVADMVLMELVQKTTDVVEDKKAEKTKKAE